MFLVFVSIAVVVAGFVGPAAADCECGYSITTADDNLEVFTDLLESDFIHVNYVGSESQEKEWAAQEYNMTAVAAARPFGESFVVRNAASNKISNRNVWIGEGSNGGDAGLQLIVNSQIVGGMVQNSEIASTSLDYFYGTFRVGLKVTAVPGT